jgi:hypothetical protein
MNNASESIGPTDPIRCIQGELFEGELALKSGDRPP